MQHQTKTHVTVLIVDDEPLIRRLVVKTLQPLGYRLLTASSTDEALRINDTTSGRIDLLLTDLIMPGDRMNGWELAQALKARRPSLEVVLMSGYPGDIVTKHISKSTGVIFIQKPFFPEKLANKLFKILDGKV